jgi:hypothetical protein
MNRLLRRATWSRSRLASFKFTSVENEEEGQRLIRSRFVFTPLCRWICFSGSLEQDPENLGARDLSSYDYVKSDKRVEGTSSQTDDVLLSSVC